QLELLENAEYYLDDAVQFLRQGRMELAVLSVGYADGLVDSLKQILEGKRASNMGRNPPCDNF
ncbi:MAG: DUF357 domain-containing protein, partial [Nitrososphaeraceae archaeon]